MAQVERIQNKVGISEDRQGNVRTWSETKSILEKCGFEIESDDYKHTRKFARYYFEAQKNIAEGNPTKARDKFKSLDKKLGYQNFEDENHFLLSIIDVAVRGKSHWDI